MKRLAAAALILGGMASALAAKPSTPEIEAVYSPQFRSCIDKSGGVTLYMRNCSAAESDRLDKTLNRDYRAALARLPNTAARERLRQSQRRWLRTRYDHCAAEAEPEQGGTLWLIIMDSCGLQAVAERIVWLRHYTG